jgi:hypothetical protein
MKPELERLDDRILPDANPFGFYFGADPTAGYTPIPDLGIDPSSLLSGLGSYANFGSYSTAITDPLGSTFSPGFFDNLFNSYNSAPQFTQFIGEVNPFTNTSIYNLYDNSGTLGGISFQGPSSSSYLDLSNFNNLFSGGYSRIGTVNPFDGTSSYNFYNPDYAGYLNTYNYSGFDTTGLDYSGFDPSSLDLSSYDLSGLSDF